MGRGSEEAGQKARGDTHARRLASLTEANRIRTERSAIKAALRAGEARAAPLVLDPPDSLRTASVAEVLLAVPGVGQVKLRRLLTSCRLSPGRKLGRLSVRQREELVQALGALG